MNRRIRFAAAAIAVAGCVAVFAAPAGAAGPNLVKDPSFESPKLSTPQRTFIAGQHMQKCVSGSFNCWLVTGGATDLVGSSVWVPKGGTQSVDLNSGALASEFSQAISTTPGTTYKVTFWLAATPGAPDNVALAVFWGNIDEHGNTTSQFEFDYGFAPFGHTATSMGWTKETFTMAATEGQARLYFLSTTNLGVGNEDFGPTVDSVSVKTP